jgi:hypothetical protein
MRISRHTEKFWCGCRKQSEAVELGILNVFKVVVKVDIVRRNFWESVMNRVSQWRYIFLSRQLP